jgi:hypothetical protein
MRAMIAYVGTVVLFVEAVGYPLLQLLHQILDECVQRFVSVLPLHPMLVETKIVQLNASDQGFLYAESADEFFVLNVPES